MAWKRIAPCGSTEDGIFDDCPYIPFLLPENLTSWQVFQEVRHQKLSTGDINILAIFALFDEIGINDGDERQKIYSDIRLIFKIFQKHRAKIEKAERNKQKLSNHKNTMQQGRSK